MTSASIVFSDLAVALKESVRNQSAFTPFFLESVQGAATVLCSKAEEAARLKRARLHNEYTLCNFCPLFKGEEICSKPLSPYSKLITAFAEFQDGFISESSFDTAVETFLSKIDGE